MTKYFKIFLSVICLHFVVACGGGGSEQSSNTPPNTGNDTSAPATPVEIPKTTKGSVSVNGVVRLPVEADFTGQYPGSAYRFTAIVQLNDGSTLDVRKPLNSALSVSLRPPTSSGTPTFTSGSGCSACSVTFDESLNGATLTFANVTLTEFVITDNILSTKTGATLTGAVFIGKTYGGLDSTSIGTFLPDYSEVSRDNDILRLKFWNLNNYVPGTWQFVYANVRNGKVIFVSAVFDPTSEAYWCENAPAAPGIPACTGVSVSADNLSVTFNQATLARFTNPSQPGQVINGTVTAKGL